MNLNDLLDRFVQLGSRLQNIEDQLGLSDEDGLSADGDGRSRQSSVVQRHHLHPVAIRLHVHVAVMDWHSRFVLSWRLSNTLDTEFCLAALDDALTTYGRPDIFNTDQGAQFTSHDFTSLLMENQIAISMDGRGRALDNVFIERLWRSVKYEDIYLKDYESGADLYCGLERYFDFYDHHRIHQALDYRTPHEVFAASLRTTSGRQTQRSKQPRPTLS